MVVIHVAANGNEWHDAVFQRDGSMCQAVKHDPRCHGRAEHAHHIVYRSHLAKRSHWIVENGVAVSDVCHQLAHKTHNGCLNMDRCNAAVVAVNVTEEIKVPKFAKKGFAA